MPTFHMDTRGHVILISIPHAPQYDFIRFWLHADKQLWADKLNNSEGRENTKIGKQQYELHWLPGSPAYNSLLVPVA